MLKERKESGLGSRKRRLSSPFRIKVGCVVALRFRAQGSQIDHEPSPAKTRFEKVFFAGKNKTFNNVWCDPKPGYDRGINLVGRYIRCCFPKSVLSGSFHTPEASSKFLEGEIVSIVKDEQLEEATLSYRRREGCGITVDLLVSRDCFKSMPFLSRFRIDSDIDPSQLSESSRRHHLNELRIKGSGKAIVRVELSAPTKQKSDERLTVRWVVRKRIFVGSLNPFDDENDSTNAVSDDVTSFSQVAKRQKITDSRNVFIGDAYDSETQQRANWRWFASKFNPMSFARAFQIPFEFFGCMISQVVGEVVNIKPEPPNSASLATVTVKRLVLPEHTLMGRLSHQSDNEIFQDFDGAKIMSADRPAFFDVPIEDILVISRKTHHVSSGVQPNVISQGLVVTGSYSLRQNKLFHLARRVQPQDLADDSCMQVEGKMSENSAAGTRESLECEHQRQLVDCTVIAAKNTDTGSLQSFERSESNTFWCTRDLLNQLTQLDFCIRHDFIPLASLVSPRPNWKKNKRMRRKSVRKSKSPAVASITTSPEEQTSSSEQHCTLAYHTNPLFGTCSRIFPFNTRRRSFDAPQSQGKSTPHAFGKPSNYPPEKVRNFRLASSPLLTRRNQEVVIQSNRALRANQRRLLRDVVSIGLNLDGLAGRDHEEHLRFDKSKIHAWGVFADKEIKENRRIVEYRGEIIGNSVAEKRELEYNKSNIGSDYMFRIDTHTVCDATKQGNVARFINHSCNPNCFTRIISIEGVQRIVIYAKRNIDSGEELSYDYKFPLELDAEKRIQCHCGAKVCRGYMNWDKRHSDSKEIAIPASKGEPMDC